MRRGGNTAQKLTGCEKLSCVLVLHRFHEDPSFGVNDESTWRRSTNLTPVIGLMMI